MKYYQLVIVSFLLIVNFSTSAFGQEINLQWDPSPSPEIAGYRVHYQQGRLQLPMAGIDALEGPSPVDVGLSLTAKLSGLHDDGIYYFTVTAYDSKGNESSYSNIVSNGWIPALLAPAPAQEMTGRPVTFRWEAAPEGHEVVYNLFYGTDEKQVVNAVAPPLAGNAPNTTPGLPPALAARLLPVMIVALLLLLAGVAASRTTRSWRPAGLVGAILLTAVLLSACADSGSDELTYVDDEGSTSDRSLIGDTQPVLVSLYKGTADYHQAFEMRADTTYYWKVVATDRYNAQLVYHSEVQSFTTE